MEGEFKYEENEEGAVTPSWDLVIRGTLRVTKICHCHFRLCCCHFQG